MSKKLTLGQAWRDAHRHDTTEQTLSLFTGRCGHRWVGATNGYYGCPVCGDADGNHHLEAMDDIAVQPDDWGTGAWTKLARLAAKLWTERHDEPA